MGCRLLKMGRLSGTRASVGGKGVRGEWKALSHKLLAASRKGRESPIGLVRVCIEVRS